MNRVDSMYLAPIVLTFLLAGCGGGEERQADEDYKGTFDPMIDTMDRAKTVEDLNADRMDELNKRVDDEQ